MTVRYLVQSGNWSNTAIWLGGAIPGPGDDVFTNGFNVTIDVPTVTVNTIQNAVGTSPVTTGGGIYTIGVACVLTITGGILHAHRHPAFSGVLLTTIAGSHAITINAPVIEAGIITANFLDCVVIIAAYTGNLVVNVPILQGGRQATALNVLGAGNFTFTGNTYGCDGSISSNLGQALRVSSVPGTFSFLGDALGDRPGGVASLGGTAVVIGGTTGNFLFRGNIISSNASPLNVATTGPMDFLCPEITSQLGGIALALGGTGPATVRATAIKCMGRNAAISISGTTRVTRISGAASGGGVLPPGPIPYPGVFPIGGRFNIIAGETFSLKMVDDSLYPNGGKVITFGAGGGSGTAVAVPGTATAVAARSVGALFSAVAETDPNSVSLVMPAAFDELNDPDLFAAQLNYVFGYEPNELGWLTVTAKGAQMIADTADAGLDPDPLPMTGTVLFTPGLTKLIKRVSTNEILAVSTALASFNATGELSFDGIEDVRLLAPLWSDLSNTTWKWTATFQPGPGQSWKSFAVTFTGAPGAIVNLGSLV